MRILSQKITRYFNESNQPPDLEDFFKSLVNRKPKPQPQGEEPQDPKKLPSPQHNKNADKKITMIL